MCLNTTSQLLKYLLSVPTLVSPRSVTLSTPGSVTGTVASITPRPSSIPEGGLEVPIIMKSKLIFTENETFVDKQVNKMTEVFTIEEAQEELEETEKEEEIIVESCDETDK